jgi:hypothetical protein
MQIIQNSIKQKIFSLNIIKEKIYEIQFSQKRTTFQKIHMLKQ